MRRLKTYLKEKNHPHPGKVIKARLGMLDLAEELRKISLVCRKAGISRMPNQTPPEREAKIPEMAEQYPAYSYIRISQPLKLAVAHS